MHFTIERGTDIDVAMQQIMDYINEQKALGYTEVKNRCHLYLNLATPRKVAFPGNGDDFIVTNDSFVNENAVLAKKGRDKTTNRVLTILREKINLPEKYKKELPSIKYYHDLAVEKKYKTIDKWKEKLEDLERKIPAAEKEVPMYQEMYNLIRQDSSTLHMLMYIETEHTRWNKTEKYIKAFPYMKYGDIWIAFTFGKWNSYDIKVYREEPAFDDIPESLFYTIDV